MKWSETRLLQVGARELGFGDHTTLVQLTRNKRLGGDWYWLAQHRGIERNGQVEKLRRAKKDAAAEARRLVDAWLLAGGGS